MSINRRRISVAVASGLLLEVINKISPLLILYHVQKTLGLAGFGWAQYQIALFESIQPFISYGFINYAIAQAGPQKNVRQAAGDLYSHIFVLKVVNSLLVLLAFVWSMHATFVQGDGWYSLGLLGTVLLAGILDAYWIFIVQHRLAAVTLLSGLLRLISLALILVVIKNPQDSHLFVVFSLMPNLILAAGSGVYGFLRLPIAAIIPKKLVEIYKVSTPFALVMVAMTLFDRMDIFLVSRWFGLETAGLYAGPAKLIQSLALLVGSMSVPFYAEIVKLDDRDLIYKHISMSLWLLMAIVAPIVFGSYFVERDLLHLVFPSLPESANHIMTILAVGMIGSVLVATFGLQVLLSKSHPLAVFKSILLGMILVMSLAWSVKSLIGFKAVAYAMVLGRLAMGFCCFYFAMAYLPKAPWAAFWKPLGAGAVMGCLLKFFNLQLLIHQVLVGGVVYLGCLVSMNYREMAVFKKHPKVVSFLKRFNR